MIQKEIQNASKVLVDMSRMIDENKNSDGTTNWEYVLADTYIALSDIDAEMATCPYELRHDLFNYLLDELIEEAL